VERTVVGATADKERVGGSFDDVPGISKFRRKSNLMDDFAICIENLNITIGIDLIL